MEKIFIKRIIILMIISMLFLVVLGSYFIKESTLQDFRNTSQAQIAQILQVLASNQQELETLRKITHKEYLNTVHILSYIIEHTPEIVDNPEELHSFANIMDVDEIHIFNEVGVITAGTIPEYIGYGVDDGEQIGYFKQILEDPTLELVQEILPATADQKLMQYSATSRKDKKGIVQIGMRPERMLYVLHKNALSYVFSNMVVNKNKHIILIEKETGVIEGLSSNTYNVLDFYNLSFAKEMIKDSVMGEYVEVSHSNYFAIIFETEYGVVCITQTRDSLVDAIIKSTIILVISLIFIIALIVISIQKLLEYHVIYGIKKIINNLREITEGNLDTIISVNNNPEFSKLSRQINVMVGSLIRSSSKISRIIDSLDINLAIYEYGKETQKVITTNRLGNILGLNAQEEHELFNDKVFFENKINSIRQGTQDKEDSMIYHLPSPRGDKYVKIKTFNDFDTTMGILIDVTDEILKRNIIMHERDYDILSELYNRRAFMREASSLFSNTKQLKISCIMMLDMDNLKTINDQYGHQYGDKYLIAGADVIRHSHVDNHTIVSRLSGDEFVIMWYGYDSQIQIIEKIEEMYARMLKTNVLVNNTHQYPVRFSGGYIFYPENSEEKETLLKLADAAMYYAKQNQKSTFVRYHPGMEAEIDN